jgi:hypothetical protein
MRAQQLWKSYVLVLAIMQSQRCFMYGGLWGFFICILNFLTYPYAKTLIRIPTLGAIWLQTTLGGLELESHVMGDHLA